jgi:hypothetical protein
MDLLGLLWRLLHEMVCPGCGMCRDHLSDDPRAPSWSKPIAIITGTGVMVLGGLIIADVLLR